MWQGTPIFGRRDIGLRTVYHAAGLLLLFTGFLTTPSLEAQQLQQDSGHAQYAMPISAFSSCSASTDAVRSADRRIERDRRDDSTSAAADQESDLTADLSVLHQSETTLDNCLVGAFGIKEQSNAAQDCAVAPFLNFQVNHHDGEPDRSVPIWRRSEDLAFFYESGMMIDADGAPNAYHPDNIGLDDLANAGEPGVWEGLAKDENGNPYIQGPDDPFPGYYVSETALADRTKPPNDPARYVDATKIPFIVLPGHMFRESGAREGDFAVVFNLENGKISPAIFADVGPEDSIGEGSIALAENLGIRSDARNGGVRRGVLYLVFPGSGNGAPRSIEEINAESARLFQEWLGHSSAPSCTRN